jgi:SEC-C motif domain protein
LKSQLRYDDAVRFDQQNPNQSMYNLTIRNQSTQNPAMQNPTVQTCPCNSQIMLNHCCGLYHAGESARNAEKLMRSRYSAYALGLIDYLVKTTLPAQQHLLDQNSIRAWSTQSTWLGLDVEDFVEFDDHIHATVTFVATWKEQQTEQKNEKGEHRHEEKSGFVKMNNEWYFLDPTVPLNIGRNEPCPCHNGAKFKKCCSPWLT